MEYTIEDFKGYNFEGALRKIWKDHLDEFLQCYYDDVLGMVTVQDVFDDLEKSLVEGKLFGRSSDLYGEANVVGFADKYFKDIWVMAHEFDLFELGEYYEFLTNTAKTLGLVLWFFILNKISLVDKENVVGLQFDDTTYNLLAKVL